MTEKEVQDIENRCNKATKGPWQSFVEGRDHVSGSSFIMTSGEDVYINPDNPNFENDQDFIAAAKQDIPKLIAAIRKLKEKIKDENS